MSDEKVIIPSNEEILDVTETDDETVVTDLGNKESAEILEDIDAK